MKRALILTIIAMLFAVPVMADTVELIATWTPNTEPDLAGYNLYYSETPGGPYLFLAKFAGKVSTGKTTAGMVYGETLYFVLTAYDTEGLESGYSNEALFRLPFPGEGIAPKAPSGFGVTGRVL